MDGKLTLKGFWWIPGAPEQKVFGVLTQSDKQIELVCHCDQNEKNLHLNTTVGGTIFGSDEKGCPVTLLITSRVGSTRPGCVETIRIKVGYVLVGIHVSDKNNIRVECIVLEIQHLYGWLGITGFKRQLNGRVGEDGMHLVIPYDTPNQIQYKIREDLRIAFGVKTNYSASSQDQSIHEDSYVRVTQSDGLTIEQVWKVASEFRSFLHFAVLEPVYIVSMKLFCWQESTRDAISNTEEVTVWSCNFHNAQTKLPWDPRWAFRYQDMSARFAECFDYWLIYNEKYGEVLDCYMTTVYHKLPATVVFLCLTQALDAYHGIRFESHKDQNFKKKIEDILNANDCVIRGLVDDKALYANQVFVTRNYYTHHNPKWLSTGNVAKGSKLMRMNEVIRILIQSCVICDMGLPIEQSVAVLRSRIASEIIMY